MDVGFLIMEILLMHRKNWPTLVSWCLLCAIGSRVQQNGPNEHQY